ncbi:MAG: DUF3419 family protein [Bacteroidota bacterium]
MPVRPHYAQSWEDPRLLHDLWARFPADHYHLIASGGDHALDLALRGYRNLDLYDVEPAQLAHVQAKQNALRRPESERNALFGYRNATQGLLHDGRLERFLSMFARRILPLLVSNRTREALRTAQSPEAQLALWDGPWQTARWRWAAHRYFEPQRVDGARHPGLTTESERIKQPINYLAQFRSALGTHALDDNPFTEYTLFGSYRVSRIPYLDEGLSDRALQQLKLHATSLEAALAQAGPGRRGIHASDILEGRTPAEVHRFFELVDRASTPGSTLIFWDHRFRTEFPEWWHQTWTPVGDLPPDRVPFYHRVYAFTKS